MVKAWVKFLARVSNKELLRYISAWEQARTWYDVGTYSYDSNQRALTGAYLVRDKRIKDKTWAGYSD